LCGLHPRVDAEPEVEHHITDPAVEVVLKKVGVLVDDDDVPMLPAFPVHTTHSLASRDC
jgi:hypothetical protein